LLLAGDVENALRNATQSRDTMEALLAANTGDGRLVRELRRELSRSYNRIGEAETKAAEMRPEGHPERLAAYSRARRAYLKALKIRKGLTEEVADSEIARELAVSYERVGDACFALGSGEEASDAYRRSFEIRERLVGTSPVTTEHLADLAVAYE